MKKSILIVSSSLSTGGLEKCLVNFCNNLDAEKYDIDLYLFNEGRDLVSKLNKNVNLLPESTLYYDVYNKSFGSSVKTLIKKKKFRLALYRINRFIRARFKRTKFKPSDWKQMKKTMLKIDKHYDVAIGFEEETACYFVAECVNADVKLGWIHTDIKMISSNKKLDEMAFSTLDKVITVSENSLNSLIETYPNFKDKFRCIPLPRLLNYEEINTLANEPNQLKSDCTNILSVGRLVELKGFHLCVPALKKLLDDGYNVKWYIAGDGDYRETVEEEIKKHGVEDKFILLGNCSNPYTYIKSADICVQPSRYEGLSVVVLEEKYFSKPVVATGIPSNLEMIDDGKNGIIVERSSDSIYQGVKKLLDDKSLMKTLAIAPIKGVSNNQEIIKAIEEEFTKN